MRRVLPLIVLAAWFAVHPVMAQDAKRQIRSVEAAQKASKARAVSPEALRRDSSPSRSTLTKRSRDPRPLQGLDNSHIPRYASVEAFRAASAPTDLRARATVVGQAEGVRRSVSKGLTQSTYPALMASIGSTCCP